MKTVKDVLQGALEILQNSNDYKLGICLAISFASKSNTDGLYQDTMDHLEANEPMIFSWFWWNRSFTGIAYWWTRDEKGHKQRIKFLKHLIKRLQ